MAWTEQDTVNAINAANQALGQVAVVSGNRRQQKRAFKYQQQAMQMQNDMWRENTEWLSEFNSPANQMARYQEAGINPNFVYGNVSAGASSGEKPTATAPDITGEQKTFLQALSHIRDIVPMFQAALKSQQDLERGEIAKAYDLERLKGAEISNRYQDEYLRNRNQQAAFDYLWATGTASDRADLIRYQRDMAKERLDNYSEENEYNRTILRPLKESYTKAQIAGMGKRYQLMSREMDMLEKYGVKSIGDMSFGGLLLNLLDGSGVLPDLMKWLSREIGTAAEGASADQPPFTSSRKHSDGSTSYHRKGASRFLFGPTRDDYNDMFPLP